MPVLPAVYSLKPWYTRRLSGVIRWAVRHNLSPDVFTAIGVAGAVLGAAGLLGQARTALLRILVVLVGGLVVRLGGANLDGAVARARRVSRPFGFVLNELGDRISDFLLFLGLYLAVAGAFEPGSSRSRSSPACRPWCRSPVPRSACRESTGRSARPSGACCSSPWPLRSRPTPVALAGSSPPSRPGRRHDADPLPADP